MNDRDLLIAAAKANGMPPEDYPWNHERNCFVYVKGGSNCRMEWDPLNDGGDAFRLACKLLMSISTGPCRATASTIALSLAGVFPEEETIHQSTEEAVRRVIVRAAAAMSEAA